MTPFLNQTIVIGGFSIFCVGVVTILFFAESGIRRMWK
jgi:hypothetical protein